MNKAIVIVPTYNEKPNIEKLIPTLLDVFKRVPQWDMHVLVVDDSSPDGTGDVVKEFGKKHHNVHLHTNAKKAGLGAAYLVGMTEAFDELKADVVFEFDADFSHDPDHIPAFLQALDAGADMVLGSRYIKGGSIPSDWGFYRKFLSVVGNIVNMVVLTDFRVRDWTTGYRAIRRKVFESLRAEMGAEQFTGYTFQIGFLHKALRRNFVVKEVPIQFVDRKIGNSKLGTEYIKRALEYILVTRFLEITQDRKFKFAVVGGIGFVINAIGLEVFRRTLHVDSGTAAAMGAEAAIISNFSFNNFWTFKERQVKTVATIIPKFIQFNLASLGAVVIQKVVVGLGTHYTTDALRFFWFVIAAAIGMIVNYIIYSRVIWKMKKS